MLFTTFGGQPLENLASRWSITQEAHRAVSRLLILQRQVRFLYELAPFGDLRADVCIELLRRASDGCRAVRCETRCHVGRSEGFDDRAIQLANDRLWHSR